MELLNILNKISFHCLLVVRHCISRIDHHAEWQHHVTMKIPPHPDLFERTGARENIRRR